RLPRPRGMGTEMSKFFYPKTKPADALIESADKWKGPDAVTFGPYAWALRLQIFAVHKGSGGGDSSSAWTELYIDGVRVGRRDEHKFNSYNATVDKVLWLERGSQIAISMKGDNSGAEIDEFGLKWNWEFLP